MNKSEHFAKLSKLSLCLLTALASNQAISQENANEKAKKEKEIEKISVVGTQIKGGKIAEALAVSIVNADDIEALGIDSGDELMAMLPENGQNFLSEAENIAGGVNSARGDVGAFNLRNLGTGNTLVLLNGRRLVNSATYQTEEVGGSFVPVNSVNSNIIPVVGLDQVQILRDGASAIYGADAVGGVINHVLKSDFEGLTVKARQFEYEGFDSGSTTFTIEAGKDFNDGMTNVSAFINYFDRDRVNSQDDARWANADFRERLPEGSPWAEGTSFRNDSGNSNFGQFDIVPSNEGDLDDNDITDSAGEFETFPLGDERCQYVINSTTCGAEDGQGTYRYNLNENRDLRSDLKRLNSFVFINHEFESGLESFTELSYYMSETNMVRHPSSSLSAVKLRVSKDNYYNPFGAVGSPNRLAEEVVGVFPDEGFDLTIDNYRFTEAPRIVDNDGETYRLLQGFRGIAGDWDWESAVSYSKATKEDITHNRISNTLLQEALNDSTEAAYNPFSGGVNTNIERALIDVKRISETELTTFDVKFSNPEVFELPAGSVGVLVGYEWREETFSDDRDDRLDGTIVFTDWEDDTYPYVSDVVNSSPTPDSSGSRVVNSIFTELQIPVLDNLDVQAALRYENFDDIDDSTTVGKLAFGYRPFESLLVRGSWSQAFRAPNLVTVNEDIVARSNTRTDYVCEYVAENGGDGAADALDCSNGIQRIASGSDKLKPETSDNTSVGFVLTPIDGLSITLDYWSIVKKDTIGLFGETNHSLLDLVMRLEDGNTNCNSTFNEAVVYAEVDANTSAYYEAAGICPTGELLQISDQYANLDKRTVEGHDLGIYYNFDTSIGTFDIKYNVSYLDKYEQEASGDSQRLVDALGDQVEGFSDLINKDGNQDERSSMKLRWYGDDWGFALNMSKIGSFYQSSLTTEDEAGNELRYIIPSMTTYNTSVYYKFELAGVDSRVKFGVSNLTDERAPLADRYFGYFADAHSDYGRGYYLDFRMKF